MSRSVDPIELWPPTKGPPPVSNQMREKLLKLKAKDAIISGPTATRSSGMITRRIVVNAPAPSIWAASLTSLGMAWSAPVQTMNQ